MQKKEHTLELKTERQKGLYISLVRYTANYYQENISTHPIPEQLALLTQILNAEYFLGDNVTLTTEVVTQLLHPLNHDLKAVQMQLVEKILDIEQWNFPSVPSNETNVSFKKTGSETSIKTSIRRKDLKASLEAKSKEIYEQNETERIRKIEREEAERKAKVLEEIGKEVLELKKKLLSCYNSTISHP